MPEITLRYPDSDFAEVVKRKTLHLKENELFPYSLFEYATHARERPEDVLDAVKREFKLVPHKSDRLVFISELLLHLDLVRAEFVRDFDSDERAMNLLSEVVHYLFRELEKLKLGVDRDAFSGAEIREVTAKVNRIIDKLDLLSAGHEVIFERIEELKQDYKDILNSFGLGKKPFFQRFAGVMASYVGEKGADQAYDALLPIFKEVFTDPTRLLLR